MAIGQPPSYSQWMQQNPDLVQQVQQRYAQQPQAAPATAPVTAQPAAPAPAQATASQPVQAAQVQPVQTGGNKTDWAGAVQQIGTTAQKPDDMPQLDAGRIAGIVGNFFGFGKKG